MKPDSEMQIEIKTATQNFFSKVVDDVDEKEEWESMFPRSLRNSEIETPSGTHLPR